MFITLTTFFSLLGLAYMIEMTVSITRIVGIKYKDDLSGALTFHSALALSSRGFVFLYMPIAGFIADIYNLEITPFYISVAYIAIPTIFFLLLKFPNTPSRLIMLMINRVENTGSYFKRYESQETYIPIKDFSLHLFHSVNLSSELLSLSKKNNMIIFISYVLYYLSWPALFIAISYAPEYRTTIFSCAALFTGLNTLCMALISDPLTLKLSKENKNLALDFLRLLLRVRLYASILVLILIILFGFLIN